MNTVLIYLPIIIMPYDHNSIWKDDNAILIGKISGKEKWRCGHCNNTYDKNATRALAHFANIKINGKPMGIIPCPKIPDDVRKKYRERIHHAEKISDAKDLAEKSHLASIQQYQRQTAKSYKSQCSNRNSSFGVTTIETDCNFSNVSSIRDSCTKEAASNVSKKARYSNIFEEEKKLPASNCDIEKKKIQACIDKLKLGFTNSLQLGCSKIQKLMLLLQTLLFQKVYHLV